MNSAEPIPTPEQKAENEIRTLLLRLLRLVAAEVAELLRQRDGVNAPRIDCPGVGGGQVDRCLRI